MSRQGKVRPLGLLVLGTAEVDLHRVIFVIIVILIITITIIITTIITTPIITTITTTTTTTIISTYPLTNRKSPD